MTFIKVTGKSGNSQDRTRSGWEPIRQLHEEIVKSIAVELTKGAWYKSWLMDSMDGSTLEIADEEGNRGAFARPSSSS
jgi:hypothetical protein